MAPVSFSIKQNPIFIFLESCITQASLLRSFSFKKGVLPRRYLGSLVDHLMQSPLESLIVMIYWVALDRWWEIRKLSFSHKLIRCNY